MSKESLDNTTGQDFEQNIPSADEASSASEVNNLSDNKEPQEEKTSQSEEEENIEVDAETEDFLTRLGLKGKSKKEVAALKKEVEELNDRYLRLLAEFENAKRRNAKERIELYKTAGQEVIQSLLPVLDDFERAIKQMDQAKDIQAVKEGVLLIHEKFKSILEQKGLKGMNSIGQDFNVEHHEAVTELPAPSEDMKGKVLDEIERGYTLNDKIIRFAKVVVGK
jgi:molecular chaperone GrpE